MSAIDQYRQLLVSLGISADVAQANGWRLRPDHVYIPHVGTHGNLQGYRKQPIGSWLQLNGQFKPNPKTKVFFPRHPARPKNIIDYLMDYSEPLILCDNLIDSIYLQSQLAQSAINAQAVYIAPKHYPKPQGFPLSTITEQKRVYYTKQTSRTLLDHLRLNGAVCHILKHSTKYPDVIEYLRDGGSIAEAVQITIRASSQTATERSLAKVQDKTQPVLQWLTTLPRQVYSLTDLHKQFMTDTGIEIGKVQLSRILTANLPRTARRSISVYVPPISYRAVATMKAYTLISIRQHDYWQTSTNEQWLAEYEQRFNTKARIGT